MAGSLLPTRFGGAGAGGGTTPEIVQSDNTPANDFSLAAGYSAVIVRKLVIANGKKIILGSGSILRIL